MKVTVAGAGAGKTTETANKIIRTHTNTPNNKNIYCITYTNSAAKNIEDILVKYYGKLPLNIKLSTIHSFLNQEIIEPFYYLLYKQQFTSISWIKLSQTHSFKNKTLKELKEKDILHIEEFSKVAMWVIHQKSGDKKEHKLLREKILNTFKNYCAHIFIDEAQDIDENINKIITKFDSIGIEIDLIGDPKQDLKGYGSFTKIQNVYKKDTIYLSECYRSPQKHLKLSNSIISKEETQYSVKTKGKLSYIYENDLQLDNYFTENDFDLAYISKKNARFKTKIEDNIGFNNLLYESKRFFVELQPDLEELQLNKIAYFFSTKVIDSYLESNNERQAMGYFTTIGGKLSKQTYARLINAIQLSKKATETGILVQSIESIKGQEGYNCLFVMTTDLCPYLFQENKTENKMRNLLYVALTRSLENLTILVTKEVESKYTRHFINDFFSKVADFYD